MGLGFPIHKVMPVVAYGWDDEASMANNNSSAFNYRVIMGTERLSNHSFGNAIDINPLQNPYFARNNRVYPAHARYQMEKPGTLVRHGAAVELFKSKGWLWGGDWTVPLDYQHFERPL